MIKLHSYNNKFKTEVSKLFLLFLTLLAFSDQCFAEESKKRPNILWLVAEDMSPWLSCYGDKTHITPTFDQMAKQGVQFNRAYVTAPVCSSCRSGLITGAMQTSLGIHNHRSSRINTKNPEHAELGLIHLPDGVKTIPELFQEAGYITFNQGKTDYNFVYDTKELYPAKGWQDAVKQNKPFFGQIQLKGGKGNKKVLTNQKRVTAEDVTVPPYYPNNDIYKDAYADHYNCVLGTDVSVNKILSNLEKDGLADDTIVFFFSDHGAPQLIRHKQFCYEGGIHIPLIIQWPKNFMITQPGKKIDDLVNTLDVSVTSLALAGIKPKEYMEGQNLFGEDYKPRDYIIAARDRCDYTIERIRSVTTKRYKYIRNFKTDRPYLQPQYRDGRPTLETLKELRTNGKMTPAQEIFCSVTRIPHEFYDLEKDPHETKNLANDPAYADAFQKHKDILANWINETDDKGQYPESVAGLLQVKYRWGSKCINPEYKLVTEKYGEIGPKKKTKN